MSTRSNQCAYRGWPLKGFCLILFLSTVLLTLAVLFYLDPFYLGYGAFRVTRDLGPLKYTLIGLGMLVLEIAAFGLLKRDVWHRRLAGVATFAGWPVYVLALLTLSGSLYARSAQGTVETFIPFSLSTVGFPLAVITYYSVSDSAVLVRRYFFLLFLALPYVIPMIVWKRMEGGQAFHSEIFLVLPLAQYVFLRSGSAWVRRTAVLCACAIALALHKNIGYLSLLFCLVYMGVIAYSRSRRPQRSYAHRAAIGFLAFLMVALAISGLAYIVSNRDVYLPTGNVEVRMELYEHALRKFSASPLFGDMFSDPTVVALERRIILGRTHVTGHSDWFDVLAHGGLLGATLLALAIGRPLLFAWHVIRKQSDRSDHLDSLHVMFAIAVCGTIASMFVSLFLSLPAAFLYWYNLGLMIAVAAATLDSPAASQVAFSTQLFRGQVSTVVKI